MKKIAFVFTAIIFCSTVYSQSISIGPQFSIFKVVDADKISAMPGAAVRINLDNLSIEGSIFSKTEKYFNGEMTAKSTPVTLSGILYVLPMLYGEFGIGWYHTKYEYSDSMAAAYNGVKSESTNDRGYHLGAGTQLEFGNLLFTGGLRYVFLTNSSTAVVRSSYYTLIVGVMYKF